MPKTNSPSKQPPDPQKEQAGNMLWKQNFFLYYTPSGMHRKLTQNMLNFRSLKNAKISGKYGVQNWNTPFFFFGPKSLVSGTNVKIFLLKFLNRKIFNWDGILVCGATGIPWLHIQELYAGLRENRVFPWLHIQDFEKRLGIIRRPKKR